MSRPCLSHHLGSATSMRFGASDGAMRAWRMLTAASCACTIGLFPREGAGLRLHAVEPVLRQVALLLLALLPTDSALRITQ